jgi:hypothetical protein
MADMIHRRYLLRSDRVHALLEERFILHREFAEDLGLSASHWCELFKRRRPLSKRVRRALREHPLTASVPPDELWQVVA